MGRHLAVRHFDAVANPLVCSGRTLWAGYAITVMAGQAVLVYDGVDAFGELIASFYALGAASPVSFVSMPGTAAVVVERGLFVETAGRAVTATIFATPETTIAAGVSVADETSFDL